MTLTSQMPIGPKAAKHSDRSVLFDVTGRPTSPLNEATSVISRPYMSTTVKRGLYNALQVFSLGGLEEFQ